VTYYPVINLGNGLAARESAGQGEGVLWIHAYALDSSSWSELWDLLPGWRHLGVDLPAHGLSLPVMPDVDLPRFARQLADLARQRSLRHVVSLGFGTLVALAVAMEAPEAIATLVLGSPLVEYGANDEPFWKRHCEMINMYLMAGHGDHLRGRLMLAKPSSFDAAAGRPELWQRLWEVVGRHSFHDLLDRSVLRLGSHPLSDVRLHGIRATTLLVLGDQERATGKRHAERLSRVIRDARSLHFLGAGAHSLIERPDQAAVAIEAHLKSRALAAAGTPGGGAA
jgi:pimeloyl-ACP methyl ester carboxylesterase